jgi:hypothetical protein
MHLIESTLIVAEHELKNEKKVTIGESCGSRPLSGGSLGLLEGDFFETKFMRRCSRGLV